MKHEAFMPLVASVLERSVRCPDVVAVMSGGDSLTYRQLREAVQCAAEELRARGVGAGNRVLLEASSSASFVVAYLAIHLSRGVAVPIDVATPRPRREFISNRVDAVLVLTVADQRDLLSRARDKPPDLAKAAAPLDIPMGSDYGDIIFTSGTTGEPKGVILTHENLAAAAHQINAFVGTRLADIEVLPLPLGHNFGLASLRSLLFAGASIVLVEGFAFPGLIYAALEEHRASSFRCVPAGLTMMLRFAPDRLADFASHIRYVELGSEPMPIEDKRRLLELLPQSHICMHYGLTEASRSIFIDFSAQRSRLTSIGKAASGVEVRILGQDGEQVPAGVVGEIQIRGLHVMEGYWRAPERTREVFDGEWLRTGDAGHADEGGFLYLDGRNAEMINVGGRKVSPSEIEAVLRTHPYVADCGCSAIADPAGVSGEAVAVLVLARQGMEVSRRDLRDFLRRQCESYKLPVKWIFSGSVPRTPNGKVQRHLLREYLEAASDQPGPVNG